MSQVLIRNTLGLKIKTPNGYESFAGIRRKFVKNICVVKYTDDTETECTLDHKFVTSRGLVEAVDLVGGDRLHNKVVEDVIIKEGNFPVFDPVEVGDNHLYFSDDVISHNCEFLGSSATLIDGRKLRTIPYVDPINVDELGDITRKDVVAIFEPPKVDRKYVITVDTGEAKGKDYSAFVVFDITEAPYRVCARFRSNSIPVMVYPTKIEEIARLYNNAWILVEVNTVGQAVAHSLKSDMGYENMFHIDFRGRGGQRLSDHGTVGVKTSKATKATGCQFLKNIIETDQLIINDFGIWTELSTFVMRANGTFAADSGKHDDLVMCLVLFAWLVKQDYFKAFFEHDITEAVLEKEQEQYAQDLAPFNVVIGEGFGPSVETFFYNGEYEYDDELFGKW